MRTNFSLFNYLFINLFYFLPFKRYKNEKVFRVKKKDNNNANTDKATSIKKTNAGRVNQRESSKRNKKQIKLAKKRRNTIKLSLNLRNLSEFILFYRIGGIDSISWSVPPLARTLVRTFMGKDHGECQRATTATARQSRRRNDARTSQSERRRSSAENDVKLSTERNVSTNPPQVSQST